MTDSALHELSRRVGILPAYYDIWGNRHEASDTSQRALLAAMDIRAETEAEAERSIHAWSQRQWHQALPPVLVARATAPLTVPYVLPESALGVPHRWCLKLEGGATHEATLLPESLERLDSRGDNGMVAVSFPLPAIDAIGYHRLEVWREDDLLAEMPLILCPDTCHRPTALGDGKRVWGLAVQLYALRSARNWGIGDYADLRQLIGWAASNGASLVGVNPLHALFPHNPLHCSPYSPSSRQYFNVLHLSVDALPELRECPEAATLIASPAFQARLLDLRSTPLVDYAAVAAEKYRVLDLLYRHFREHHLAAGTPRGQEFRAFQASGGEDLRLFALYHALQEHFNRQDASLWGWPTWPQAYQMPESPEVAAFAAVNQERVEWLQWLQWLVDQQLAGVAGQVSESGMGIGLYQDLAVGVDKGGAETWMHGELYALEAKVGCPPDDFSPMGQDWGLPPWVPHRLREAAYAPFIAMLRANMRHAGALRIDHVMSLMRLYWVPPGLKGNEGAYVAYPFQDLLGILALESQRNCCLVVGEDLGTVPDEVRAALYALGVLSYRLFYFERDHDGSFRPPGHYPAQALVAASTHDLPTLIGFWEGVDLELRERLNLNPSEQVRLAQVTARAEDRVRLLAALEREALLPQGLGSDASLAEMEPALISAIHRYLARTPASIVLVQAEDMLGEPEQANVPGTTDQHPNWQRKLSLNIEAWPDDSRIHRLATNMATEQRAA